ncbi:Orn/Lys/Arg family decarboxylase [Streptomyces sp. NPDC054975]
MSPGRVVPAAEAVGRVSADTLAAYPPGIPNVLPGEVITSQTVRFLQLTAAAPNGHVRGAVDPLVSHFRVVTGGRP